MIEAEEVKKILSARDKIAEYTDKINEMKKQIQFANTEVIGNLETRILSMILDHFSEECGLDSLEFFGKTRKQDYVFNRQIAQTWLHQMSVLLPNNTLKRVGKITGNRHHSTVIHAMQCMEDYQVTDKKKKAIINYHFQKLSEKENVIAKEIGLKNETVPEA